MDRSAAEYQYLRLPIADLVPYAKNSRTHKPAQVEQLAAAMRKWGFTNPVLVDAAGGIIAGHGRVMAAQKVGLAEVPVIRITGLSEEEQRALVIADNQLALNSGWDKAVLANELADLKGAGFDLGLVGFDNAALKTLLQPTSAEGLTDPDDAPDVAEASVSKVGDLWHLGVHRVACGDSTAAATWSLLMRGEKADLCWTDPPYNVAYNSKAGSIQNDNLADADFLGLIRRMFQAVFEVMRPGAAIYVAHADTEGLNFRRAFADAGFKLSGCLIWRKDCLVMGRSDYQWMHEPILYGWKPGAAHNWYGGRKQTTVAEYGASGAISQRADGTWVIQVGDEVLLVNGKATLEVLPSSVVFHERPRRSSMHPTMKPVALIEKQLRSSAAAGDVVIDCCGGSGSTLIACERLGMRSRLAELEPRFVDVIVRRWEAFTGGQAVRESDGLTFQEATRRASECAAESQPQPT